MSLSPVPKRQKLEEKKEREEKEEEEGNSGSFSLLNGLSTYTPINRMCLSYLEKKELVRMKEVNRVWNGLVSNRECWKHQWVYNYISGSQLIDEIEKEIKVSCLGTKLQFWGCGELEEDEIHEEIMHSLHERIVLCLGPLVNVTHLDYQNHKNPCIETLASLKYFPNLAHLSISGSIEDKVINLERLFYHWSHLTEFSLEYIVSVGSLHPLTLLSETLTKLKINGAIIQNKILAPITDLINLVELHLEFEGLEFEEDSGNVNNLTFKDFDRNGRYGIDFANYPVSFFPGYKLKNLKTLYLSNQACLLLPSFQSKYLLVEDEKEESNTHIQLENLIVSISIISSTMFGAEGFSFMRDVSFSSLKKLRIRDKSRRHLHGKNTFNMEFLLGLDNLEFLFLTNLRVEKQFAGDLPLEEQLRCMLPVSCEVRVRRCKLV